MCLSLCLPNTILAASSFAHVFRIDLAEAPDATSGVMTSYDENAFLSFLSSPPSGSDALVQWVSTGAYFAETGELLWSLRPAQPLEVFVGQPPPPAPDPFPFQAWASLEPGQDANTVHVTYDSGTGLHRFGIVDAASLAPA
jgi:hypothetical protein